MRVISHRGNLYGPNKDTENKIDCVVDCLNKKLEVEIDIHVKNNNLYLDHDGNLNNPLSAISLAEFFFLFEDYKDKLWIHCKNLESIIFCQQHLCNYNYFGHSNDEFVLTSKGYIFTRPGVNYGKNIVCVMPELIKLNINEVKKYNLVLTDYPLLYI